MYRSSGTGHQAHKPGRTQQSRVHVTGWIPRPLMELLLNCLRRVNRGMQGGLDTGETVVLWIWIFLWRCRLMTMAVCSRPPCSCCPFWPLSISGRLPLGIQKPRWEAPRRQARRARDRQRTDAQPPQLVRYAAPRCQHTTRSFLLLFLPQNSATSTAFRPFPIRTGVSTWMQHLTISRNETRAALSQMVNFVARFFSSRVKAAADPRQSVTCRDPMLSNVKSASLRAYGSIKFLSSINRDICSRSRL